MFHIAEIKKEPKSNIDAVSPLTNKWAIDQNITASKTGYFMAGFNLPGGKAKIISNISESAIIDSATWVRPIGNIYNISLSDRA